MIVGAQGLIGGTQFPLIPGMPIAVLAPRKRKVNRHEELAMKDRGFSFQQACDEFFGDACGQLMRETAYSRLLTALRSNDLKAIGIRTKPTVDLKPSQIPPFIFDTPRIDWFFDTVENAGSKFEQVRIYRLGTGLSRNVGRPSNREVIDFILLELIEEGYSVSVHQKQTCAEVRKRLAATGVDLSQGFSDSVIKSRVGRVVKRT